MRAYCTDCRVTFDRPEEEPWKHRCLACWRASKTPPDARDVWYMRGYFAGKAEAAATTEPAPSILDAAHIRKLLQLCHPDRHGGSELAVKATQWLLECRRDVRHG